MGKDYGCSGREMKSIVFTVLMKLIHVKSNALRKRVNESRLGLLAHGRPTKPGVLIFRQLVLLGEVTGLSVPCTDVAACLPSRVRNARPHGHAVAHLGGDI